MPIEFTPPPAGRSIRRTYDALFEILTTLPSGEWASLPLDEVGGPTNRHKQSTLHVAAVCRGRKVQTTIQQGRIYARII